MIGGAPEGYDSLLLAQIAADVSSPTSQVLYIAPHDSGMNRISNSLRFFSPNLQITTIPAWDCLPYDRVSPHTEIVAQRLDALTRLSSGHRESAAGFITLTTVNAMLQRVTPRVVLENAILIATEGEDLPQDKLLKFLTTHGYRSSGTVREPGEFALRGGIVDIFPTGADSPLRLDFFGDELERIRAFDPMTQRTSGALKSIVLQPVSEVMLSSETITLFRDQYRRLFGTQSSNDPLYEAISAGHSHGGMEHWLPLFHSSLETLFDYLPGATIVLDPQAEHAIDARLEQINEFYDARLTMSTTTRKSETDVPPYRPIEPSMLFLDGDEWSRRLASHPTAVFSRFEAPVSTNIVNAGGIRSRDFSEARQVFRE